MKVSIIIPCYNVEKYISDCFKSVEKQTYDDLEVIFVNDGSSDKTVEILEKLISASSLNAILIHQKNKGAASARNNGLRHSSGFYIQFLDADDILNSEKIKHQMDLTIKMNFPSIIVGSYQRQNMKGEILTEKIYDLECHDNIWTHLMRTDLGNTCSNLFNSDSFKKNGIQWNENLRSSQEYDLMFQISKVSDKIIFDSQPNTIIRVRDSGSISQQEIDIKWERYVRLRVDIIKYLKEVAPQIIDDNINHILFTCIRMLYPHNPQKAVSYFEEYIPRKFVPHISNATGRGYVITYKLLGFRKTERIRQYITKNKAH